MKSPTISQKSPGPPYLEALVLLFLLGSLISCSTSSKFAQTPFNPAHWHKVSNNPPTYYPKGVSANHPTGPNDGTWFNTGDASLTSYFVPLRGADTKNLIAQAEAQVMSGSAEGGSTGSMKDGFGAAALGIGNGLLGLDRHMSQQNGGRGPQGGAIYNAQNQQGY